MATSLNQTISLHINEPNNEDVVPLETNHDIDPQLQTYEIPLTETPIKKSKCMIILYITFICCSIVSLVLQFTDVINLNLILFVNTAGGILLIVWIIYQFRDSSLSICFMKRDLYLPLLFHVMDTSSDLATTYIFYLSYKSTLNTLDSMATVPTDWESEMEYQPSSDTDTQAELELEATTSLQLFFCSIFILFSYRIVSSFIIYVYTNKWRLCCLQCLDLYIYEILMKSWQLDKTRATLLQLYVSQLEAYFESFPQLLLNLQFITETIVSSDPEDVSTLSLIFVMISGFLSITSVAIKARKSDERFFRPNANIREMKNQNGNKKCCLSWKYMLHILYRYCDVWYRAYTLNIIWYNIGRGGFAVVGIILFDFFGAVLISSIEHKCINFDLISCIAITPIVSSKKRSVLLVFSYRIIQNITFLYFTISLTDIVDQLFIVEEGPDTETFPFMVVTVVSYVFVTIMSFVYFCEGISDKEGGFNVIKKHSVTNTQRFEGIENADELKELIQFGYRLKNANDIKKANYATMSDIIAVYNIIINNINDDGLKQECIVAWKHIDNAHHGGNLLHQFCKNNASNDVNNTLRFIVCDLEYDVNSRSRYNEVLTPLMIAAMNQSDVSMIKLLIEQYNADSNAYTDNRSPLYYAHKYNKSKAKPDIIEYLKSKMTHNTDTALPGQVLIDLSFDLEKDLSLLKLQYGDKYGELLPRNMVEMDGLDDVETHTLSVMQFNVLADGLCGAYSSGVNAKTFVNADKECLQWRYRGIRLIEEMLRFKPDIIGLQECDQLSFLMKYLLREGYKSYFQIKTTSPIPKIAQSLSEERNEEMDMNSDGVALIYRSDKFEISSVQHIDSDNREKVFGLAVGLKQISNNKAFLCLVTHLKSTKTSDGEQLRERQINLLLNELVKNDDNLPVIVCCDLNANPIKNEKGYDPLCYNAITDKENLGFQSVYKLANENDEEPEYTTVKCRETGVEKHTLDYIFIKHCHDWNIHAILDIPEMQSQSFIPDWSYPSDHFSICVKLSWC